MSKETLKGKVQTVLGIIEPDSLHVTLMHEHILADVSVLLSLPNEASLRSIANQPVNLENLYLIRYNPLINIDNCQFTDENLMTKEVSYFKEDGGKSIVETSSTGLHGDPLGLARISRKTGINIIKGSGFYIGKSQSPEVLEKSEEELAQIIINEITIGFGDTGIKAGLIGEIGCNAPIDNFERKSLIAGALAQKETGSLMSIHPSYSDDLIIENINILKKAGADLSRVVVCHCDLGVEVFSLETIYKLLEEGCIVEFDTFGYEGIFPFSWNRHINHPTDQDRIKIIKGIIEKGYIKQIVISSDRCHKHLLRTYGGGGYSHIIRHDLKLMKINGIDEAEINEIVIENPKRLLQFV